MLGPVLGEIEGTGTRVELVNGTSLGRTITGVGDTGDTSAMTPTSGESCENTVRLLLLLVLALD